MKICKGIMVWLLQAVATLAVFWTATATIWLPGPWYEIAAWGLMPILGAASAYLAARRGVNNYIAWLAPPICVYLAHYIAVGYAPDEAGPTLLAALLAIVGAAAGHVRNNMKK